MNNTGSLGHYNDDPSHLDPKNCIEDLASFLESHKHQPTYCDCFIE